MLIEEAETAFGFSPSVPATNDTTGRPKARLTVTTTQVKFRFKYSQQPYMIFHNNDIEA